jgi:hypothetical protein
VEEPNQTISSFTISKGMPHSKQDEKKPPKYKDKDQIKLKKGSLSIMESFIVTACHG